MLEGLFWSVPPRILGGWGCRREVAPLIKRLGLTRSLIVTDRFFSQETNLVEELRSELEQQGVRSLVFDGGIPDPTVEVCREAKQAVEQQGWLNVIDHIIALGGGSNIDLAKVLSLTLEHGGEPRDYMGESGIKGLPLPLIALPTTAGTGAEITPGAILVDQESATKVAIMANDLRARVAVIDPELTASCPQIVTAHSGLDALTHAIESYLTQDALVFDREGDPDPVYAGRTSLTRLFAAEATKLCFQHLLTAYRDGNDRGAREGMATGSLYAALSYGSAGLNAVHALAYALAGLTHQTHGSTNAVYLPYVMDALLDVRESDLAEIGRLAGAQGSDNRTLARNAVKATRDLVANVGVPTTLRDFGVKESDLDELIKNGLDVTRLTKAYPIQPPDSSYRQIVENAFHGKLEADQD